MGLVVDRLELLDADLAVVGNGIAFLVAEESMAQAGMDAGKSSEIATMSIRESHTMSIRPLTFHMAAVIVTYDIITFRKTRMYTIITSPKPLVFLILRMLHVATIAGIRIIPIQITLTKIAKFIFLYLCNADASKSTCTGSKSNNIDKNNDRPASGWRGS